MYPERSSTVARGYHHIIAVAVTRLDEAITDLSRAWSEGDLSEAGLALPLLDQVRASLYLPVDRPALASPAEEPTL